MTRNSRKPTVDEFVLAVRQYGGNITKVAESFQVTRQTVHNWAREDEEFAAAIKDSRMRMFDRCLDVGYALALGIPELDKDKKVVGWVEKPDANMIRYLLGTLGREEGFGDKTDVNLESNQPITINVVSANGEKIVP